MKIHRSLFGGGGNAKENRRLLHFWARFIMSMANTMCLFYILYLLFFSTVSKESRDFFSVLLGALVVTQGKISDHWFKDKREDDQEEGK